MSSINMFTNGESVVAWGFDLVVKLKLPLLLLSVLKSTAKIIIQNRFSESTKS